MNTELIHFHDAAPTPADFRDEIVRGLSARPKRIAPKFFYDRRGSALFEQICRAPEYYLTRVEIDILKKHTPELAALAGPGCVLIELGSGASSKVRLLLEALRPAAYLGIDISREFLLEATLELARAYPWLEVHAACADLCRPLALTALPRGRRRIAFYPGSSIGNFEPPEAHVLLRGLHPLLGPDGALLIGVDLKKDPAVLHAAYNDIAGVTAAFNVNLLVRLRRELRGQVNVAGFSHQAFYNEALGRVEMHLASRQAQRIQLGHVSFAFAPGETIHTENSYKYSIEEFYALSRAAGYAVERTWTDPEKMFSVHYLHVAA